MPATLFAYVGACGALLMFVADLVLYLPNDRSQWSTAVYFARIDPGGGQLLHSPMSELGEQRMMTGGVLGPVAALLYTIGFLCVPAAVRSTDSTLCWYASLTASFGLSGMMITGACYHALFTVTGLITRDESRKSVNKSGEPRDSDASGNLKQILVPLMNSHRRYLLFTYKVAAGFGAVGCGALVVCCVSSAGRLPLWLAALAPACSAPLKKLLKKVGMGPPLGLVLAGGLTNLWNLVFFGSFALAVS